MVRTAYGDQASNLLGAGIPWVVVNHLVIRHGHWANLRGTVVGKERIKEPLAAC